MLLFPGGIKHSYYIYQSSFINEKSVSGNQILDGKKKYKKFPTAGELSGNRLPDQDSNITPLMGAWNLQSVK